IDGSTGKVYLGEVPVVPSPVVEYFEGRMHAGAADAAELVARALAADPSLPLIAGGGALSKEMIRVNHYGVDATRGAVLSSLAALGAALADTGRQVDFEAARKAVSETWPSE
ncbi:hypothetical protein R6M67_14345, partial [Streptomyces sp. Wh19]|nr:hypothetical protein [Streptomyces sp. Wh19]